MNIDIPAMNVVPLDAPVKHDIAQNIWPEDERLWVPLNDTAWSAPLLFDTSEGYWVHLLKITAGGVFSRHMHPSPVHGITLQGRWGYLEHDWTASAGTYIYEPPGDLHTLVVEEGEDMITWFRTAGAVIYVDENRQPTGMDTVHTRIDLTRRHYRNVGLDVSLVDAMIR